MNYRDIPPGSKSEKPSQDVVEPIAAVVSLGAALGVVGILKSLGLPDDAVIVTVILLLPLFI